MGVTSTAASPDGLPEGLRDFRGVYRAHYGFVWHALHRFGTAPMMLDDAVQDVFVVAYRRRADYRGPTPKPWLYGIARRVASNYRRSTRRRQQRDQALPGATSADPTDTTREAIEMLERWLAALSPDDRELFVLAKLEGMTGRELAEATGRNMQTIYTRLRKLETELHENLGELERVRRARPRATAQSWAMLVPTLHASALPAAGTVATATWGWVVAALGVAALGLVVLDPRHEDGPVAPATEVRHDDAPPAREVHGAPADPTSTLDAVSPGSLALETDAPPSMAAHEKVPRPHVDPVQPRARGDDDATDPLPSESEGLREETELLRRASSALQAGNATEALRATTDHGRRFPGSALADLRTAVRIEALCELGKSAQARGEARVFLRAHPGSPVAERIERACTPSPKKSPDPDKTGT